MELAKRFGKYFFFGPGYNDYNETWTLEDLLRGHKPDVLFFMFPTRDIERKKFLSTLRYGKFDGPKVYYDTDAQSSIWPRCAFINKHRIEYLFLGNNNQYIDDHIELINLPCHVQWLPFGVNTNYFTDFGYYRTKKLMFLGSTNERHYAYRIHMIAVLKRVFGADFFFKPTNEINREVYVRVMNDHRIFASAGDQAKGFFMKYLESMACGCLLITQRGPCYQPLGFVHGRHLILWKNYNELIEYCKHYLENDEERKRIAQQGREFVLKNHTWGHRVDTMLGAIKW
jgi:glycosyltransferase involved in cell wall biosynthesis